MCAFCALPPLTLHNPLILYPQTRLTVFSSNLSFFQYSLLVGSPILYTQESQIHKSVFSSNQELRAARSNSSCSVPVLLSVTTGTFCQGALETEPLCLLTSRLTPIQPILHTSGYDLLERQTCSSIAA